MYTIYIILIGYSEGIIYEELTTQKELQGSVVK
jgi:hypothetical protein